MTFYNFKVLYFSHWILRLWKLKQNIKKNIYDYKIKKLLFLIRIFLLIRNIGKLIFMKDKFKFKNTTENYKQ